MFVLALFPSPRCISPSKPKALTGRDAIRVESWAGAKLEKRAPVLAAPTGSHVGLGQAQLNGCHCGFFCLGGETARMRTTDWGFLPAPSLSTSLSLSLHHSSAVYAEDLSAVWQRVDTKCMHMWFNACRKCIFVTAPDLSVIPQGWNNVPTAYTGRNRNWMLPRWGVLFSVFRFLEYIGPVTPTSCRVSSCKETLIAVVSGDQGHLVMREKCVIEESWELITDITVNLVLYVKDFTF